MAVNHPNEIKNSVGPLIIPHQREEGWGGDECRCRETRKREVI